MENSTRVLQKIRTVITTAPNKLTSEKGTENRISKKHLHAHVNCSSFTAVKIWKQPICPPMDEENVAYTYNGILALKKKEPLSFPTTWTSLENIMLSEISQPQEDKNEATYIRYLKQPNSSGWKRKYLVLTRGLGAEEIEFSSHRVSVMQDGKVLKLCCMMACI